MVKHIDEKGLEEIENSQGVILVDFYATWCPPCKKLAPVLDELASSRKYNIVSINVDENINAATKYSVDTIPTLIVFKDGKPVKSSVGFIPKEKVMEMLDEYMI